MHPFLRVVVILMVGAAIGAVVAGGAISYVKGSPEPAPPTQEGSTWEASSSEPSHSEDAAPIERSGDGGDMPLSNIRRSDGAPRFYGSEGPAASVSTDPSFAPPPSPPTSRSRRDEKKGSPVVEEEAEPKDSKVREEGASGDADGGSVR